MGQNILKETRINGKENAKHEQLKNDEEKHQKMRL